MRFSSIQLQGRSRFFTTRKHHLFGWIYVAGQSSNEKKQSQLLHSLAFFPFGFYVCCVALVTKTSRSRRIAVEIKYTHIHLRGSECYFVRNKSLVSIEIRDVHPYTYLCGFDFLRQIDKYVHFSLDGLEPNKIRAREIRGQKKCID